MRLLLSLLLLPATLLIWCKTIDLSGQWKFTAGDTPVYEDSIKLPGSMLTNGKGLPVTTSTRWVGSLYDSSYYFNPNMEAYRREGNIKIPFFLTPDKHYVGNAWYKRNAYVPSDWAEGVVELHLERPHITTSIFVNGQRAGRDSTLSVPHVFDISKFLKYGASNEIVIQVNNEIDNVCVGQDSHSVSDQTQGDWNGIAGCIQLIHRPSVRFDDMQIFPLVDQKAVKVKIKTLGAKDGQIVTFACTDKDGMSLVMPSMTMHADTATFLLPMGDDVKLWDEHSPALYTLTASLAGGESRKVRFGMREISIKGRQFYLNGSPIWMRGTVENCCFPLTGYPPTNIDSWRNVFAKCKEYGLNSMRFHSYCPPEAAFDAADELGFYLQPEGPSWPNHGVKLGVGMTIDSYLLEETQRMVKEYGNHPSFCLLAAGNEPAGHWVEWVTDFCNYWRSTGDNRRVYCGASVGGGWAWDPASDFHVKGGARGLDWDKKAPQSTDDFYSPITSHTQKGRTVQVFEVNEPFLSHEQGQWCAFPDLEETSQYTGPYKARNFEIFADLLKNNGMEEQAKNFLYASGRLQTLAYKYEIEKNLRTPEYAGFQLLSLNDYSGQGTALVGVLNVFWKEKGYCNAEEWTQFCAPVVPLAEFAKFVFGDDEPVNVQLQLYNAYKPLSSAKVNYSILRDSDVVHTADYIIPEIPLGKNFTLPAMNYTPSISGLPEKYTLKASVEDGEDKWHNQWDFWVYPSNKELSGDGDVLVTDSLTDKAINHLRSGKSVLLTAAGKVKFGADVKQSYLPVFWNTSWFKMRPPHTTGAYIDTKHPLFNSFPSDTWANLNWWELLNGAQVINLAAMPADYQSPIQPIDTWHVSRKLGMLLEANVEGGKLLMTTMDISSDLESRLVARNMRNALIEYMNSPEFSPTVSLPAQTIHMLYESEAQHVDMFTNDSPDELKPKLK